MTLPNLVEDQCPHCGNDDVKLIRPGNIHKEYHRISTQFYCEVCSRSWIVERPISSKV